MIVIVFFLIGIVNSQVSHLPILPKVEKVTFSPNVKTVPSTTLIQQTFTNLGYQIGGTVYETHNGLLSEQIHNSSFYNKSTSCQLYNSQLSLKVINEVELIIGINIQSFSISQKSREIYYVKSNDSYSDENKTSQRVLLANPFTIEGISTKSRNISIPDLKLNDSQSLDVMLVAAGDYLILTDGVKIVGLNAHNFSNHWEIELDSSASKTYTYEFAAQNDLLHLKLCHYDSKYNIAIIQATWNTAIRVYQIKDNLLKATLKHEFLPPNGSQFTDAIPDHGKYWALVQGNFIAYRPNKAGIIQPTIVQLQSKECFALDKFQTTVHIICREDGLNYVGQYFFNQSFVKPSQALFLNRYYTEIDDAKTLFRFGTDYSPKLIISGDYDLQIVPYAINRQVLIDSESIPRTRRLKSLGVQQIYSILEYSNSTHSVAIGVGQSYLAMFQIIQQPPVVECMFVRTSSDIRWNILVEINSSSCIANGDWEQLQSICSYEIPYTFYASLIQVDATQHTTVVVTVFILLLAIAILLIGCALFCKSNLKKAGAELKKKMAALKKQKQMKPI